MKSCRPGLIRFCGASGSVGAAEPSVSLMILEYCGGTGNCSRVATVSACSQNGEKANYGGREAGI
jgi:hypothetical protein